MSLDWLGTVERMPGIDLHPGDNTIHGVSSLSRVRTPNARIDMQRCPVMALTSDNTSHGKS